MTAKENPIKYGDLARLRGRRTLISASLKAAQVPALAVLAVPQYSG
jgi:hypothetical protein